MPSLEFLKTGFDRVDPARGVDEPGGDEDGITEKAMT